MTSEELKQRGYAIAVGVDQDGAVNLAECPHTGKGWHYCACGQCAVCGEDKHMAIHGPLYGADPGTKPWGHRFVPAPAPSAGRQEER